MVLTESSFYKNMLLVGVDLLRVSEYSSPTTSQEDPTSLTVQDVTIVPSTILDENK